MESGRARATDCGSGGLGLAERYRFEAVLSRGDSIPGLAEASMASMAAKEIEMLEP